MKLKTILLCLLLGVILTQQGAGQHATWWGSSPPQYSTRDYTISYGNGFEWQVALGNALSEDEAHDAIALSSSGYLVAGPSYYYSGNTYLGTKLALYRLNENGGLVWEKQYTIEDFTGYSGFQVIEKPDGGFLVAGILNGGTNPPAGILFNLDASGDTLSTSFWRFSSGGVSGLKLIKSYFDETFFFSLRRYVSGIYTTHIFRLNYQLDTIGVTEIPSNLSSTYIPKPYGYLCYSGKLFDYVYYYYNRNFQGVVLDSFPDPLGSYDYYTDLLYPVQRLRSGANAFFRNADDNPRTFKMATTNDAGSVLQINNSCFSSTELFWYTDAGTTIAPHEFSDGSICAPFNWYLAFYDNAAIGLVKINQQGHYLGDTVLTRSAGSMWMKKVMEGADGRPVLFGRGENGPIGNNDIFIAKLATWNPVGIPFIAANNYKPLQAYPNIVNSTLNVEIPHGAKGLLTVTTSGGATVLSQQVNNEGLLTLDATQWPSGVLILCLTTPDCSYSSKLIKN